LPRIQDEGPRNDLVRVKVCGLTSISDALSAVEAGADWVGLNFHPTSPRRIDPTLAARIVAALPSSCEAVGLFVNRPPSEIKRIANEVGFKIVQLHGNEPPTDLLELSSFRIIRAFRIGSVESIDSMNSYVYTAATLGRAPDDVLVDAEVAGQFGGTGHSISTHLVSPLREIPRLILAGGLTPLNVAERVRLFHPWMVDVASGVESAPGVKDRALMARFVQQARSTFES